MTQLKYVLASYSLESELGIAEVAIPATALKIVQDAAGIDAVNWERLECWPLTQGQARDIGKILGERIDGSEAHYFIESREVWCA